MAHLLAEPKDEMLKLAVGEQLVAVGQLVVGEQLVAGGQLVVGAASMEEDQAAAVTTMVALFDWRLGAQRTAIARAAMEVHLAGSRSRRVEHNRMAGAHSAAPLRAALGL